MTKKEGLYLMVLSQGQDSIITLYYLQKDIMCDEKKKSTTFPFKLQQTCESCELHFILFYYSRKENHNKEWQTSKWAQRAIP
jgi:hypothetical protein